MTTASRRGMAAASLALPTLSLLTLCLGPVAARTDDTAATMEGWGIIGTWAPDCSVPPSRGNTFYTYSRRDGAVMLDRDGAGFKDSSRITRATVRPDGMLEYHVDFGGGSKVHVNTFAKRADGKIRIFFNRSVGGRVTVKDGFLVPQATETTWQERCPPGTSV